MVRWLVWFGAGCGAVDDAALRGAVSGAPSEVVSTGAPTSTSPPTTEATPSTVDSAETTSPGDTGAEPVDDTGPPSPCPVEMVHVVDVCMDRFEAPNLPGEPPLVMYTFDQAEAWCVHRDKRLCFDDEWEAACEGPKGSAYPYGADHEPGRCNDEEVWRTYSAARMATWPSAASHVLIGTYAELIAEAEGLHADAAAHIEELYQGEGGGDNAGCGGGYGVFDLVGNAEEWTRRADGGAEWFHGNLKGRYWAESRTCQSNVTVHGDAFRFYEIGFRCCMAPR